MNYPEAKKPNRVPVSKVASILLSHAAHIHGATSGRKPTPDMEGFRVHGLGSKTPNLVTTDGGISVLVVENSEPSPEMDAVLAFSDGSGILPMEGVRGISIHLSPEASDMFALEVLRSRYLHIRREKREAFIESLVGSITENEGE